MTSKKNIPFNTTSEWALISGFEDLEEIEHMYDAVPDGKWHAPIYLVDNVVNKILSFPGTQETHPSISSWLDWSARWQEQESYIDFHSPYVFKDNNQFLRVQINASCDLKDFIAFVNFIRDSFPCIYPLHWPTTRVYTTIETVVDLVTRPD